MVIKVIFPRKFWFFVWLCKFWFFFFFFFFFVGVLLPFLIGEKGLDCELSYWFGWICLFWIDGLCLVAEKTLYLKNWSAFYEKKEKETDPLFYLEVKVRIFFFRKEIDKILIFRSVLCGHWKFVTNSLVLHYLNVFGCWETVVN